MKRASTGGWLILFILIVVLVISLYLLYQNIPGELQDLKIINNIENDRIPGGNYSSSQQFYSNMRFPDKEISYHISSECDDSRNFDALNAFSILEEETILSFYPKPKNEAEIMVLCSDVAPEPEEEGHFIAGEGGPSEIINTSLYSVIFSGKMSLFREDKCEETKVALHELLHVLGFEHNNNPNSILYPTLNCNQKFDEEIIEEINRLYAQEGLPDLKIIEVDATKAGRYLNFEVKVVNQGLKATGGKLTVYGGDDIIEFRDPETNEDIPYLDLGLVEVGTTKIFTVQNAKLSSRGVDVITFIVDEENNIKEIFEDNNRVELTI